MLINYSRQYCSPATLIELTYDRCRKIPFSCIRFNEIEGYYNRCNELKVHLKWDLLIKRLSVGA